MKKCTLNNKPRTTRLSSVASVGCCSASEICSFCSSSSCASCWTWLLSSISRSRAASARRRSCAMESWISRQTSLFAGSFSRPITNLHQPDGNQPEAVNWSSAFVQAVVQHTHFRGTLRSTTYSFISSTGQLFSMHMKF